MRLARRILAASVIALTVACQPAPASLSEADQAVFMPLPEKTLTGTAAIEGWFKALPPVSNVKFTVQAMEGAGDMAYVQGAYTFTITPPGAAQMEVAAADAMIVMKLNGPRLVR